MCRRISSVWVICGIWFFNLKCKRATRSKKKVWMVVLSCFDNNPQKSLILLREYDWRKKKSLWYLSFFCDRLSSMYLYFWYCSSSFLSTASAVSLPGCFMKVSTSSWNRITKKLNHNGWARTEFANTLLWTSYSLFLLHKNINNWTKTNCGYWPCWWVNDLTSTHFKNKSWFTKTIFYLLFMRYDNPYYK